MSQILSHLCLPFNQLSSSGRGSWVAEVWKYPRSEHEVPIFFYFRRETSKERLEAERESMRVADWNQRGDYTYVMDTPVSLAEYKKMHAKVYGEFLKTNANPIQIEV